MRFKIVDITLLVVAVVGFAMTITALRERSTLNTEYETYVAKIGRLRIDEPEKIYAKRMLTDIADHFAWRVYLPPPKNRGLESRVFNGDDECTTSTTNPHWDSGKEETIRVTLRRTEQGVAACFGARALSKIKDERVSRFIAQNWDDLRFEIAGANGTLIQNGDEAVQLLAVTLPEELADEFVADHGEEYRAAVERPFTFYYGYQGAKGWP